MIISKKNLLFIFLILASSSTNFCVSNNSWISSIRKFFSSLTSGQFLKKPSLSKRWIGVGGLTIASIAGTYAAWKYFNKKKDDFGSYSDDDFPIITSSSEEVNLENSELAEYKKDLENLQKFKIPWADIKDANIIYSKKNEEKETRSSKTDPEKFEEDAVVFNSNNKEQPKTQTIKQETIETAQPEDIIDQTEQMVDKPTIQEPEEIQVSPDKPKKQHNFAVEDIIRIINNASMRMVPIDYEFYKSVAQTAQLPIKADTDFKDGYTNSVGIIREVNDNDTVTVEVRSIGRNEKSKKLEPQNFSAHFTILSTDIIKLKLNAIKVSKNRNKSQSNLKEKMFVKILMKTGVNVFEKNMIGIVNKVKDIDQKAQVSYFPHWVAASLSTKGTPQSTSFDFKDLRIIETPSAKKLK